MYTLILLMCSSLRGGRLVKLVRNTGNMVGGVSEHSRFHVLKLLYTMHV